MTPTESINMRYHDDLDIFTLVPGTEGVRMLAPQRDRDNTTLATLL